MTKFKMHRADSGGGRRQDAERKKLLRFIKVGIVVLLAFAVIGGAVELISGVTQAAAGTKERKLPIYCVDTEENKVAISFDAAWGNEDTQMLLDILKEYGVHATFFMTGGWVEKFPEDVKKIAAAGHDLGNHSENHKQMSQLSAKECTDEIMKVHEKVKALTGKEMTLFRPPYGDYNNTLVEAVKECGYYCIQWDVDSLDWKNYGVDSIIKTVCEHKHLGNGSIVLMHNGAKYIAEALPKVIEGLRAKGYEIVPISELIIKENYHMDHEGRQIKD